MRKLALALCGVCAMLVVVMLVLGATAGVTQEVHEYVVTPQRYATDLLANPSATRLLFAIDLAFLALYTILFVALASYLAARGAPRALLWLAVGAVVVVATLDIAEDHHILALLDLAEHGGVPSDGAMVVQQAISGAKFTISALALACFGLCVPRDRLLGKLLGGFLILGPLATTVVANASSPDHRPQLDGGRWVGFLVGFALAGAWLRGEADPESR